jgi:superfamily I DNA and/or RNA helicase
MLEAWAKNQSDLIDLERDAEQSMLSDKITSQSAKACQSEGLSLLNLEIDSTKTALFGRCCISLQRQDKGQILQSFKVGDEVSLYNPKHKQDAESSRVSLEKNNAIVMGLIGKITKFKVEIVVDEFDDNLFEAPLRLDLRSSQKTHTSMKHALNSLVEFGYDHPLVNLLFNPDLSDSSSLLQPSLRNIKELSSSDLWNPFLNASQCGAINCALSAPPITIVHGPPGTGKTSTLTELILQAVNRNQKVLVCAPSNIAVDTILGRLADFQAQSPGQKRAAVAAATANAKRKAKLFNTSGGGCGGVEEDKVAATSSEVFRRPLAAAAKMVRIGHPARISSKIMRYTLDSMVSADEVRHCFVFKFLNYCTSFVC